MYQAVRRRRVILRDDLSCVKATRFNHAVLTLSIYASVIEIC